MSTIVVCSGKGSPGATFVAVNLSVALARTRERVMLVDLDLSGGDVAAYLGLDPHRGLYPLLRMERGVPELAAIAREAEERSGVLAVGGFPVEASAEARNVLPEVMANLRVHDSVVVADLGRIASHTAVLCVHADLVLIVVRPDLVSVLGAERGLRALDEAGVPRDRVRAVISASECRRPADLAEVGTALKVGVAGSIPFARRAARQSLIRQAPVAKRRVFKSFGELAASVLGSCDVTVAIEEPAARIEVPA